MYKVDIAQQSLSSSMQCQSLVRTTTRATGSQSQHPWPIRAQHLRSRHHQLPQQQLSGAQQQRHALLVRAHQASSASAGVTLVSRSNDEHQHNAAQQQQQQQPAIEYLGELNGMQTVRGTMHLNASADVLYALLTDYESSTRVFENIASTEVLVGEDGGKQVLQACKWQFLALAGTFSLQLAVQEEPASRMLVFKLIKSSFMRDFEGRWQVTPTGKSSCMVEHVLAVKPFMPIPAAIGQYTKNIFTRQVTAILADLSLEVDRQTGAVAAGNVL